MLNSARSGIMFFVGLFCVAVRLSVHCGVLCNCASTTLVAIDRLTLKLKRHKLKYLKTCLGANFDLDCARCDDTFDF